VSVRLFLAAALPALVLYVSTLAPSVSSEDSGELITAASTLGIAHPPGYPLWCLLGKLFTLLPAGSVAWRVNLLSAVLGATAAGMLAVIARRLTGSFAASLAAALVFAASRDFWGQAVIAEVYTLNVLAVLVLVWLVLRHDETLQRRWLYLAASAVGLGLSNHSTLGPLGPLFFAWVFLRHPGLLRLPVFLLNVALAFLLGFALVLYLPIRSAADPVMDWGNPETLSATVEHVLRRAYTEADEPRPRTVVGQLTLAGLFFSNYAQQFTPALAALSLAGAVECARRRLRAACLLLPLFGMTSYGFIWLLNYPPNREHLHLTRVFFLPAYAVGALWLAMEFDAIRRALEARVVFRRRALHALLTTSAAAAVLLPLSVHFSANDRSGDFLARDWGRNILLSLKPNAIILPSADHSTFPLLYLQTVEGLRPDVLNGNKYGYIEPRFFDEVFRGRDPPRLPPPRGGSRLDQERFLVEHSGRPVYLTTKTDLGLGGWELLTYGLVFEARPRGEPPHATAAEDQLWRGFDFDAASLDRAPGDFGSDLILADYHYACGRRDLLAGRTGAALEAFRRAAGHGFGIPAFLNNVASALAEAGRHQDALPFLEEALALDPDYKLAVQNLASVYCALGRYADGLAVFQRALEAEHGHPLFCLALARAHRDRGEAVLARIAYENLLGRDPKDQELQKEYEAFVEKAFGKEKLERQSRRMPAASSARRGSSW
jgi:Tfp pilus assembly protein PilF